MDRLQAESNIIARTFELEEKNESETLINSIIGLSATVDNERKLTEAYQYTKAIELSGGIPIIFPYTDKKETLKSFVKMCDGFSFTGGADVTPSRYGEEKSAECGTTQPYRDELEFALFEEIVKSGKPIIGICRGLQLINAALGGTLYQDINSQYKTSIMHRHDTSKFDLYHHVRIIENTPLSRLTSNGKYK